MKRIGFAELTARLLDGAQVFFLRRQALSSFGDSRDDFLKSFTVAALLFPAFLLAVHSGDQSRYADSAPLVRFGAHTVYYTIAWVYWPLIMAYVSQSTAHPENWIRYVVTINWMMATPLLLQVVIVLGHGESDAVAMNGLLTGLRLWSLLIHGWLLRIFFRTSMGFTVVLVIADYIINIALSIVEHRIILSL